MDPRDRAAQDQADASWIDVARLLGLYRDALIQNGFRPDEAAALARDAQQHFIVPAYLQGDGGDEDEGLAY